MISLKVLNSIVLLGTSCGLVKEANMEEKLFQSPPSASSSRTNSRAHRPKHTPPTAEPIIEDGGMSSASVTSQPTYHMPEIPSPALPTSQSDDRFLTTPDDEDDDKDVSAATGDEGEELKHRNPTPKKDLLEIDRFTICGNRID